MWEKGDLFIDVNSWHGVVVNIVIGWRKSNALLWIQE